MRFDEYEPQSLAGDRPQMKRSRSSYDVDHPGPMDDQLQSSKMDHFAPLVESLRSILQGDSQIILRDTKATIVEELPDQKTLDTATEDATIKDSDSSQDRKEADDRLTFAQSTTLFNSAAPLAAWIVVRPRSVEDVIKTIKFCVENKLSPSIRSGGYSTAGWSIQGDVVLDMRSMNKIRVLPLSERYNPAYRLNKKGSKNGSGSNSTGQSGDAAPPYPKSHTKHSKSRVADENAQPNLNNDGTSKRRKGNEIDIPTEAVQDADSGAEGDAETSSGSKGGSSGRSGSDQENDTIIQDSTLVSHSPLEQHSSARPLSSSGNGTPQSNSTSSGEPSHSSTTATDENNGATTGTSLDVDMSDGIRSKLDSHLLAEQQQRADNLDGKEHHRSLIDRSFDQNRIASSSSQTTSPNSAVPSASDRRLVLPTTGGFIWTAGDASLGTSSMGTTRPLNSGDPVYLGGSTFTDLRSAQSYLDTPNDETSGGFGFTGSHSGATPGLHGMALINDMENNASGRQPSVSPLSEHYLKPGIHLDKYVLVEFEPGVGVRDLDVYTDRVGREGLPKFGSQNMSPSSSNEKGKSKHQEPTQANMDQNGLSFTLEDGIPYHVPLSAYPVGSTAMTIGGFGYLSRAYGLSLDNIVELDVVLADGRLKTLNASSAESKEQEDRDLWWALRGAAPCFGIVTRIIAKAYPVPKVFAGNLIYPFNPATAPSLLRHWRDCLKGTGESIPRELYSNLILTAGPPDAKAEHVIVIQICYLGTGSSEEIGHSFVQAINSWTGERVLLKDVSEKPMITQQDGVAQVLKSGQGRRWMVRGDLLKTLTDEVIAKSVEQFRLMANGAVWLFELIGGAIEDEIENNSTCVGEAQRRAKFTAGALQQWNDQNEDEECVKGVEAWVNEVLAPVSVGGPFAAFLERGETRERCEGAFGKENFERLLDIKRRIDPQGLFCHTFGRGLCDFMKDQ